MSLHKPKHSTVHIRPADRLDIKAIQDLYRYLDSLHSQQQSEIYTQAVRDPGYIHDALANPLGVAFCAAGGDNVVGFAYAYEFRPPHLSIFVQQRYALIDAVVVHPEWRRARIGTRLVEAVRRWSADAGHAHVELAVYAFNDEALAFYNELGFKTLSVKVFCPNR